MWLFRSWFLAWVVLLGCSPQHTLVGNAECPRCDAGGGFDSSRLLDKDPQAAEFDPAEFERIARGIEGDWVGVVTTSEDSFLNVEMSFHPSPENNEAPSGAGAFEGRCLQASVFCPWAPAFGDEATMPADGTYLLQNVSADRAGRGIMTVRGFLLQFNEMRLLPLPALTFTIQVGPLKMPVVLARSGGRMQ